MKFVLLVEGQTEHSAAAAFLKRWLDARLSRPIGIQTVSFEGYPKLLDRIYRQQTRRGYKKTTYGRQLFPKLDPNAAASKCPRLLEMLNEMLELARTAGLG